MPDIYRRLGEKVRHERQRLGWTQEELANKADLHPAYVGQIERSQKKVSLATVERLALALDVGVGDLLDSKPSASKSATIESRIGGLLRDKTASEKTILYTTLKQLARSIHKR